MEVKDRLHLIGSIPLDNSEQVFRRLADELGPFLRCMPDGETGERSRWVYFQRQMLLDHPAMEIDPTVPPYKFVQWDGKVVREIEQLRFKPGVDPATVKFETGYDKAALASWEVFKKLRADGAIPSHVRFQVCLPTPQASGYLYVSGPARETYFGVYERALKTALANIARRSRRRISRSSGTSARRSWPSRITSRTVRPTTRSRSSTCWGGWAMPCRKASKWAITSAMARRATSIWCSPRIPPFWSR